VGAHPWNVDFAWRPCAAAPRRLTEAQLEQFDELGYLVVEDLIDDALRLRLTDELDQLDEEAEAVLRSMPDERMFIAEAGAITFSPHAVHRSEAARDASRHPAVVDVVHDLVGPDVRLYWDQLVYKKPDKPRRFPWHQDNGYTFLDPQQYLTVWLALSDAPVDAGCPWVVPGLHRGGTLIHDYIDPLGHQCFDDHPDAVPAPVRAGGAVVFSSLTPHMTGPNVTDATRKTYILQYAPDGAEAWQGDPSVGAPVERIPQNDPTRQYPVLSGGTAA